MTYAPSIGFEDVLDLLKSPLLQDAEAEFASHLGLHVSSDWGDSQRLTRELASTGITRKDLEEVASKGVET